MTPFGQKMRQLREERGITLKEMAADLHLSSAYLSALEHGNRGRPSPGLVMQICGYFGIIWDDVEDLKRLAALSHPKVTLDTSGLSPTATELANRLSERIRELPEEVLERMLEMVRDE
ncbi:helix-turn-helix domain-containing protein [Telmatospirillum sp. J64-1]|uniref:helix-turn-helix domain-containing protein n=1 Tax=Telmatospirillum sp. J64-1 TaxID=2502183 RepID=UPI00115EFCAB|nr:helix-turn-helix domain-containing protein [Telmatospirillum sp. J64-1]